MKCPHCTERSVPCGRNRSDTRRARCLACRRMFSEPRHILPSRYLSLDTTSMVAKLLPEGNSLGGTAG